MVDNTIKYQDFPGEKIKLKRIFTNQKLLEKAVDGFSTPQKIKEAQGDFYLFPLPEKRPQLWASYVSSLDGKIAFPDRQDGTLIARANWLNSTGALADYWLLNVYRTYADAVFLGGSTLAAEPDLTGAVYDRDLVQIRTSKLKKKTEQPVNIIITRSGENLPAEHQIYHHLAFPTWIYTFTDSLTKLEAALDFSFKKINLKDILQGRMEIKELFSRDKLFVIHSSAQKSGECHLNFLAALKKIGINRVLIEPSRYVWQLMQAGLLDELFLNFSGIFVGGDISLGRGNPFGLSEVPLGKIVTVALKEDNFFYTRQKLYYQNQRKKNDEI